MSHYGSIPAQIVHHLLDGTAALTCRTPRAALLEFLQPGLSPILCPRLFRWGRIYDALQPVQEQLLLGSRQSGDGILNFGEPPHALKIAPFPQQPSFQKRCLACFRWVVGIRNSPASSRQPTPDFALAFNDIEVLPDQFLGVISAGFRVFPVHVRHEAGAPKQTGGDRDAHEAAGKRPPPP